MVVFGASAVMRFLSSLAQDFIEDPADAYLAVVEAGHS